jgi:hypothetical protein
VRTSQERAEHPDEEELDEHTDDLPTAGVLGDSRGTLGQPSLIDPGFSNPNPTVLHGTLCGLLAAWLQGSLRLEDAAALAALLRQRPVAGLELWLEGVGSGAASAPPLLPQFVASVAAVPT